MEEVQLEHRLSDVENRSKSNTKRIDKLEETTDSINKLATAVEVMANKTDRVAKSVEKLDVKVTSLENKPAKRWDSFITTIITVITTGILAFLLGKFGM